MGPVLRQYPPEASVDGVLEAENGQVVGVVMTTRRGVAEVRAACKDGGGILIVRDEGVGEGPGWMPREREAGREWVRQLEAAVGAGVRLVIWPTAVGAVSDVPSLRTFLREAEERGRAWAFLFDAEAMLTPEMRAKAQDHRVRWQEELGEHPARWGTRVGERVEPGAAHG